MRPLSPAALSLAIAALIPLSACNKSQPEVVDNRAPDPLAEQIKNAPAVALPPAMEASATFRCKDNSLIYVDFFEGHKQANLRTEKTGSATQLTAPADGQPYTGGGYALSGNAKSVEYTAPGKSALSCKA
jgi:hypothetical protein